MPAQIATSPLMLNAPAPLVSYPAATAFLSPTTVLIVLFFSRYSSLLPAQASCHVATVSALALLCKLFGLLNDYPGEYRKSASWRIIDPACSKRITVPDRVEQDEPLHEVARDYNVSYEAVRPVIHATH